MQGKWIEVKVITTSEAVEPISGIFYGLDVKGVAIEDPNDIASREQGPLSWDFADSNIFEYGDKAAVVKGYFSQEEDIEKIIKYIEDKIKELKGLGVNVGDGKVIHMAVFEEDWATSWKKYYKTLKLGKRIVIKPTWEDYDKKDDELIIELDPGMAFGTGTHETTMMCVELLEKYVDGDDVVFDIGTGSGILAITASKLGAKKVVGVDLDEVAVDAAKENVNFNNLDNVEIKCGNLVEVVEGKADIIVANIIADVIVHLTKIVKPFMKNESLFISSGIINDRKEDVLKALEDANFSILEIREMGDWVAIVSKIK
ncbi:ribosomal protein L11 methyltransferase [Fervidicella metallireducens AeB]|uniref:Ribosomal protein L11 methyltransferase n=1 Tax=Fervidicella metallireducens AeB TaxID=1403537 RepID=A0A017RUN1_9CLOT|nr:50S ribosomal protein L11 methyltransferase [Fervidicella metallireducens]EYE88114.1 ribosomal protein L11 methyltransferase [Fervidicella metallireducens AeB]